MTDLIPDNSGRGNAYLAQLKHEADKLHDMWEWFYGLSNTMPGISDSYQWIAIQHFLAVSADEASKAFFDAEGGCHD